MNAQPTPLVDDWGITRLRYVPDEVRNRRSDKQEAFLKAPHLELLYGGAAGGGKSIALLMAALQYVDVPGYNALLLRKSYSDLNKPGGLMDVARSWLTHTDARWKNDMHAWEFPSGATLSFGYLSTESDKFNYHSAEYHFLGFDELTEFCHHPATECLTEHGWRLVKDVQVGERVLSLAPDGAAEMAPVTAVTHQWYNGNLVHETHRSNRYAVTENHRVVIEQQREPHAWRVAQARDLPAYPHYPFRHTWDGVEVGSVPVQLVTGRGVGANANQASRVSGDDYLGLLGWYLAEGSAFHQRKRAASPVVTISQTRPAPDLDALMERLPWRSRRTEGEGWRIFSRQLYEHLAPLGDTYTKRVPRWVMSLSTRQLSIVWDAFIRGDGHRDERHGGVAFGLANEGLIDDLQEIAVRLGLRSTKGQSKARGQYDVWRLSVHAESRTSIGTPYTRYHQPYSGPVYCLTVEPHHTFLIRYDGRVSWTGNTESMYLYLFSRLRRGPDRGAALDGTRLSDIPLRCRGASNPGGRGHDWVAERFIDPTTRAAHFIPATLDDNPNIDTAAYELSMMKLSSIDRRRLRYGDWDATEEGDLFKTGTIWLVDDWEPAVAAVRYWDLASTEQSETNRDPDYSVGTRWELGTDGYFTVIDVKRDRLPPGEVEAFVDAVSRADGFHVHVYIEQDPGQAGKAQVHQYAKRLRGRIVRPGLTRGRAKRERAVPVAAAFENRVARLNRAMPNLREVLGEMRRFPNGAHDDIVDTLSGGYSALSGGNVQTVTSTSSPASNAAAAARGGGAAPALPRLPESVAGMMRTRTRR